MRHTERGCGEADLLDEIADLCGVKGHELVDLIHAVEAIVSSDGVAELAAAEQGGEELVQMGQEEAVAGVNGMFRSTWEMGRTIDCSLGSRLLCHP